MCLAFGALLFALCFAAEAQQAGKTARIGFLFPSELSAIYFESFRQGLNELGYVEGQNISIEFRSAKGGAERFPDLAAELVRLKVDVMVVASTGATLAAKNATGTIPLVFVGPSDPVSLGIVASFAKPGANITGLTLGGPELYGKRLELLAETIPGLSRLVFLREPANPSADLALKQMAAPAQNLGLLIQSFEVRTANDIQTAFKEAVKTQAGATIVGPYPPISTQRKLVIDLAIKNRIPAMYGDRQWPDAGGLMSYGVNTSDLYRRAAYYVDKILKGTKPGDLPVEQPTKFELVINLKTAKQIGLTIPQSVLYRADKVIR